MSVVLLKYSERDCIASTLAIQSIERKLNNKQFVSPPTIEWLNDLVKGQKKRDREHARRLKLVSKMTEEEIQLEIENNSRAIQLIDEEIERLKSAYSQQ